jgi:hypothetical protein
MSAAFGRYADAAEAYFAALVKAFKAGGPHEHKTLLRDRSPAARSKLAEIAASAAEARRNFTAASRADKSAAVKLSLRLLAIHAEHVGLIARAHVAGIDGDTKAIQKMRAAYEQRLPAILRDYAPWIDPLIGGPVMQAFSAAERVQKA